METYSLDVPGSTRDGGLHLAERATTAQRCSSTGEQITEQRVEQSNPGDPSSGLNLTILVNDRMRPGPCGTQAIRNNSDAGSNGSFGVVSVDLTKSDNVPAIRIQVAPSEKPK